MLYRGYKNSIEFWNCPASHVWWHRRKTAFIAHHSWHDFIAAGDQIEAAWGQGPLQDLGDPQSCYPLVNCPIAMERSTIFHGKINYFDWAIFNSYVTNYQRVMGKHMLKRAIHDFLHCIPKFEDHSFGKCQLDIAWPPANTVHFRFTFPHNMKGPRGLLGIPVAVGGKHPNLLCYLLPW